MTQSLPERLNQAFAFFLRVASFVAAAAIITTIETGIQLPPALESFSVATRTPVCGLTGGPSTLPFEALAVALAGAASDAIVKALLSILNGPATSTVAVNGPATFLGSRHESEHVPPHPYWKL